MDTLTHEAPRWPAAAPRATGTAEPVDRPRSRRKRPGPALARLPACPAPTLAQTVLVLGQLALLAALLGWLVQRLLPHLPL